MVLKGSITVLNMRRYCLKGCSPVVEEVHYSQVCSLSPHYHGLYHNADSEELTCLHHNTAVAHHSSYQYWYCHNCYGQRKISWESCTVHHLVAAHYLHKPLAHSKSHYCCLMPGHLKMTRSSKMMSHGCCQRGCHRCYSVGGDYEEEELVGRQ